MAVNQWEPRTNYFKVNHLILEDNRFKVLSPSAKVLYLGLCKLRNRIQRGSRNYFIRSDRQLVEDTGMARASVTKAKQELYKARFIDMVTGRSRRTRYHIFEHHLVAQGLGQEWPEK